MSELAGETSEHAMVRHDSGEGAVAADGPTPVTEGLTDRQLEAVDMLVAGMRPGVVAKQLEMSREQLWRWRQEPDFQSHMTRMRVEMHHARVDRMWNITDHALDVIDEHIAEGDVQVALAHMRNVGFRGTESLPGRPEVA
jgi:hypothetical protein